MQMFTSVLVLSIVFAVFVITDINSYKERKVKSVKSIAQVVGTNSISTLQFQDEDAAKEILSELHNVAPEIINAAILDKNGNLFASYNRPGSDTFIIPSNKNVGSSTFHDHSLLVNNPIVNENEIIGNVFLNVELNELQQIKKSKYEITAVLLIVALGFSFLIGAAVQPYISKRLLRLLKTMNEVTESGDYSKKISDDGKDEISVLIKVYNNLMLQVRKNQQKKDEFIGIASHEFKTPLTSIKGYLDLLDLMENDEGKKQLVGKAQRNVNKLEVLIKDLLDVSKIQSGQLELNMQRFNIDELIKETIAAFQMLSPTHHLILKNTSGEAFVYADKQRIEQVLINLLSNAIKYSPGEKEVIISYEKNDTDMIIKITDFGIGIAEEERLNIFERFYRTKDISVHISGFGLGLYICRDIIKRHNGKIWVETQGKGSSFYFTLPLKTKEPVLQQKV
ncbi:MAG: ATP-binding protein [Bacteroidota bacterium]